MKNKKGFTLVELLAVLIVLIIVVLIAVNVITGRVKEAKKNTIEVNANNYIKAVNGVASLSQNIGEDMERGTYQVRDLNKKDIKMNGDKPRRGFLILSNYEVSMGCLMYDDYSAIITGGKTTSIVTGGCNNFEAIFSGVNFSYTGNQQTYKIPLSGTYKLEVWGAQGGDANNDYVGGYGGYSVGEMYLTEGTTLYINVGGEGKSGCLSTDCAGGYNGGGSGAGDTSYNLPSSSGGGATHIALSTGLLSSFGTNQDNLLIVAGGGGGTSFQEPSYTGVGGSGGGFTGVAGTYLSSGYVSGGGGTQLTGGAAGNTSRGTAGSFGQGGNGTLYSGGGGGGYYGGGASNQSGAGAGSGYIGNYALNNSEMYCYGCTEKTIPTLTTKNIECAEDDALEKCAKKGNGHARLTFIKEQKTSKDVLYLYSSGNEFNSITGGWFATNTQSNGRTEKLNNNLHIYCQSTGSSGSRYTTTNSIDLSGYTKLHVVYNIVSLVSSNDSWNKLYIQAGSTSMNSANKNAGYYHDVLNILSATNGQVILQNVDANMKIMQVWLSKD